MPVFKITPETPLPDAARRYATKLGWKIFPVHTPGKDGTCTCGKVPCENAGKHPRTPDGVDAVARATTKQIEEWWTDWPNANIGCATGKRNGFFVLDVDPRDGGDISLELLVRQNGPLPPTRHHITGGAGYHYFFRMPEGINIPNSASSLAPGLDIKGDGGYIILPPSRHASGRVYDMNGGDVPILDPPEWLLSLILKNAQKTQPIVSEGQAPYTSTRGFVVPDEIKSGARNATLFSLARSLSRKGLSQDAALSAITAENQTRCVPPLNPSELKEIVESAYSSRYIKGELSVSLPAAPQIFKGSTTEAQLEIAEIAEQTCIKTPILDKKTGVVTGYKLSLDNQKLSLFIIDRFNTISTGGEIWICKDGIYSRDLGEIHSLITSVAREVGMQKQTDNVAQINSILLGTNFYAETPFNYKVGYLPVRNGYITIDFESAVVNGPFPHEPDNLFTYCLPVDFDPNAPTDPVVQLFREWVNDEDVDLLPQIPAQGIVQSMIDDTFKKSYLLQGERNSGKSSYLELLYRTLGKKSGALSLVSLHAMTTNRFALAEMENTILNCYDDLGDEELSGFGTFKKLTGATYHQIERKNKNPRNARIFCTHVFACNIPPRVPERAKYDPAFWDRWEYIVFPYTHEINPLFHDERFTDEFLSGFLNLIIATMIRIYKERKLVVNRDAEEVMEKWFLDADPLNQFFEEMTATNDSGKPITSPKRFDKLRLYTYYTEWCRDKGVDQRKVIPSIEKFSRDIQKYGFIPSKQRITVGKHSEVVNCYIAARVWVGGQLQIEPSIKRLDN